jgi:sulfur-carrier protein adenylyltransferase/sulfurtransferase
MESLLLSNQEMRRYNRQIMLPELGTEGQEKLKQARVLVVGAGGLGSAALQYLAGSGIGEIGIADNDLVEESNLQRQVLYGSFDLGKQKAIIAKERLETLNNLGHYTIRNLFINEQNAIHIFNDYDVIVDATDNYTARFVLNNACLELNKPLVYGAIYKFQGQVSVFNYQGGPSLSDLYPVMPDSENSPLASEQGILGVLAGLIGTLQAAEVIKIITGAGSVLSGKLLIADLFNSGFEIFHFRKI